eukprot:3752482-Pyramimonas_sp.AAC.2
MAMLVLGHKYHLVELPVASVGVRRKEYKRGVHQVCNSPTSITNVELPGGGFVTAFVICAGSHR